MVDANRPDLFLGQTGAAVAADVVISTQAASVAPDHDQALAGDLADDKIARVGDLVGPSRVDPHAEEKPLELGAIILRVDVIPGGQAHGLGRQWGPSVSTSCMSVASGS